MRHLPFHFILGLLAATFVGCTKAAPEISALSFSLPALKPADDPFGDSKSVDDTGYVLLSGQCDRAVTGFQIQFDDLPWFALPATPEAPVNGTLNGFTYAEVAPAFSYDVDCSDGQFKFWFYVHQVDAWASAALGRPVSVQSDGDDGYHPKWLRVRGVSPLFYTEPMVFDTDRNDGGGGPADHLVLSQWSDPRGASTAENCVMVELSVRNATDGYTRTTAAFDVTIQASVLLGTSETGASGGLWLSQEGCNKGTPTADLVVDGKLTVPASQSYLVFYKKVAGAPGDKFKLRAVPTGVWSGTHRDLLIDVVNGSDKYLSFIGPWSAVRGACYPASVEIRRFDGSYMTPDATVRPLDLTGTNALVQLFKDQTCATPLSDPKFDIYQNKAEFFIRVASGPTTLTTSLSFGVAGVRPLVRDLRWVATGSAAERAVVQGPSSVVINQTSPFGFQLQGRDGAAIILDAGAEKTVTVTVEPADAGAFYEMGSCGVGGQPPCSGPAVSQITFVSGDYERRYEFLPTQQGPAKITVSSPGLGSTTFPLSIQSPP